MREVSVWELEVGGHDERDGKEGGREESDL